jgi:exodeoxyribonuclease VII large subunit
MTLDLSSSNSIERTILTPTQVNAIARELIENAFPLLWIEGEISNFSKPSSGHLYFTLKDSAAQLRCAMFKPRSSYLKCRPSDGMQVLLRGRISFYEARGEFQFIAEHLEQSGEGALRRKLDLLKAQLQSEGLFDQARKRALPRMPKRLGIITSPTGAALHDVLTVLARRWPICELDVLPVPVQGDGAATQITAMLKKAYACARYDVLLLTRGGGSLEDLWAFNDEQLARTIAASPIPIISAVGHEVDFSISDWVADLRAPTPSAAAEMLAPNVDSFIQDLTRSLRHLETAIDRKLRVIAQHIDHQYTRLHIQHPQQRLHHIDTKLDGLKTRLSSAMLHLLTTKSNEQQQKQWQLSAASPTQKIEINKHHLNHLRQKLIMAVVQSLQTSVSRLATLARSLNALNPLTTLDRGYSITRLIDQGHIVKHSRQVQINQALSIQLSKGTLQVRVEQITE